MTSVENCVIILSSPSTILPMNGCRTCVRSADDKCEQYSDTALTAEMRTHGGCDGLIPATVACRNLHNPNTLYPNDYSHTFKTHVNNRHKLVVTTAICLHGPVKTSRNE